MVKFLLGDVLEVGADLICHQVNCKGVMGSGVAKGIASRYPYVFETYRRLCQEYSDCSKYLLGKVHLVPVKRLEGPQGMSQSTSEFVKIINCFGQNLYGSLRNVVYTDMEALTKCMTCIHDSFGDTNMRMAVPYLIGAGRGNADPREVQDLLIRTFMRDSLSVEVYLKE